MMHYQKNGIFCGKWLSVMLLRVLPPSGAEKAEEGMFVTAIALAKAWLDGLEIGILSDNKSRLEKKGKKK